MGASGTTNGPDPRNYIGCCDPCTTVRQGGNRYLYALLDGNVGGGVPDPTSECCRCIPRATIFRFTPDADAECCYSTAHIVHPDLENYGGWLKAVYEDDMYDKTFELSVGRFSLYMDSSGYEDFNAYDFDPYGYCDYEDPYTIGECAWRLRVYDDGGTLESYELFPIASGNDCLSPPTGVYAVSGPPGCTGGNISFHPYVKTKLPYVLMDNVVDENFFIDLCPDTCSGNLLPPCISIQSGNVSYPHQISTYISGSPTYYSDITKQTVWWDSGNNLWAMFDESYNRIAYRETTSGCPLGVWYPTNDSDIFCVSHCHTGDDYNTTDVSILCGQCTQTCSGICVSGNWRENGWEFIGLDWTKYLIPSGGGNIVKQGWKYTDPVTSGVEYLWLEDSGSGCQLNTEFSYNNFPNILIGSGCSCDLYEQSHSQPWPGDYYWYSVHCGHCSEYQFKCGSCRCIPDHLCLTYILNDSISDIYLGWDSDLQQWGDDNTSSMTVHLESDNGICNMITYYSGEPLYLYVPDDYTDPSPIYTQELASSELDCKKELWVAHTDSEYNHPLLLPEKDGVRLTYNLKCRRSDADTVAFVHEGYLQPASGFMYITGNGVQDENCSIINCSSFFYEECPSACIDRPKRLSATMMLRTFDYEAGYGQSWSFDTELSLVIQPESNGNFYCAYIGTKTIECEIAGQTVYEGWTIACQEDGFSFHTKYWVDSGGTPVAKQLVHQFSEVGISVSCDPIYAETGWDFITSDPDTSLRAGLMCTSGEDEDDRPAEANLIITEWV